MKTMAWALALMIAAPAFAQTPISDGVSVPMPSKDAGVRVPLDLATPEQLAALEHIDMPMAQRIVDLRKKRGGLDSVESLRILGMSEDALISLRKGTVVRVTIDGGGGTTATTPEAVLAEFDNEPDVRNVQRWASEYARVQPELVQRWLRASKAFGALPRVRSFYQLRDDWQNDFRRFDEFGNPPTSNDVGVQDVQTDADVGQQRTVYVELIWYLYDVVMSPEQLRMIGEAQDIAKLREKILTEVTRLYFERRRLQVDMLLNPKSDLLGQVKDELRLRELSANIDALTGGRFSAALAP
jgi:hypothetical protein